MCYAIFLVTFAIIVFVGDSVEDQYPLGEVRTTCPLHTAFVYVLRVHSIAHSIIT